MTESTDAPLVSWDRPLYEADGGHALLFYVVFGAIDQTAPLSRSRYRSAGPREELDVCRQRRPDQAEAIDAYTSGYLAEVLRAEQPALAEAILAQDECAALRGVFEDPDTLDYLRDTVGVITWMLDNGGVGVYDPQSFRWWSPEDWRKHVFDPAGPAPRHHVTILASPEEDGRGTWLHTRGMRKFGRPDVSVHGVPEDKGGAVIEMINRFIEHQALGLVIPEGQPIEMDGLPEGLTCHRGGHLDDPEFNNVHIEVRGL